MYRSVTVPFITNRRTVRQTAKSRSYYMVARCPAEINQLLLILSTSS